MVDLHVGGQVLELLKGIENATIAHNRRATVVSIHVGTMALDLERKESSVGDICLDLEARGGAREGVGAYIFTVIAILKIAGGTCRTRSAAADGAWRRCESPSGAEGAACVSRSVHMTA